MSTESQGSEGNGESRRGFLVKLGLGVAGLVGMSSGLASLNKSEPITTSSEEFPGPDSIFHPAQDPRTDPRRG